MSGMLSMLSGMCFFKAKKRHLSTVLQRWLKSIPSLRTPAVKPKAPGPDWAESIHRMENQRRSGGIRRNSEEFTNWKTEIWCNLMRVTWVVTTVHICGCTSSCAARISKGLLAWAEFLKLLHCCSLHWFWRSGWLESRLCDKLTQWWLGK